MWVGLGWVGLDLCYGLGWVEFFFDPPWWVGSKNPLNQTQPDSYTPLQINTRFVCSGNPCVKIIFLVF